MDTGLQYATIHWAMDGDRFETTTQITQRSAWRQAVNHSESTRQMTGFQTLQNVWIDSSRFKGDKATGHSSQGMESKTWRHWDPFPRIPCVPH